VRYLREPPTDKVLWESDAATGSAPGAPVPYLFIVMIYAQTMAHSIAFFMMPTQLTFLIHDQGGGPLVGGLAISIASLGIALSALVYARLRRWGSPAELFVGSFLCLAAGYWIIAVADSIAILILGAFIAGSGLGLIFPNGTVWLIDRTPQHVRGRVLGGYSTSTFLGHFLSPVVSQTVASVIGLPWTFAAMGAAMALIAAGFFVYSLSERR